MNSDDIRKQIEVSLRKEEKTKQLRKELSKTFSEDEVEQKWNFIKIYISSCPKILDIVYSASQKNNLLTVFQPVFNVIFNYWTEEYDIIPDNLGLVGLCDDAYLSLKLMQKLAEQDIPGTSSKLMNIDFIIKTNATMRDLIGEPAASQLDTIIEQTFMSVSFQSILSNLLNNPTLINLINSGQWFTGGGNYTQSMEDTVRGSDVWQVAANAGYFY